MEALKGERSIGETSTENEQRGRVLQAYIICCGHITRSTASNKCCVGASKGGGAQFHEAPPWEDQKLQCKWEQC